MISKYTLLLALSLCILPATAMDAPQQKASNSIVKTVLVTLDEGPVEARKVKIKIRVNTPESATTDETKNAYYATRKAEVHDRLQQILIAYEKAKNGTDINSDWMTVHPTALFFDFDANIFMVRRNWGTHTLTRTVTAHLETRTNCKYRIEDNTLIANGPAIHIKDKGSGKKQSILMETLHNMYPHDNELNVNSTNMIQHAIRVAQMALERQLGILRGGNSAELPDPIAYTHGLILEDLKKMVAYYLSIPPVD